MTDELAHLLHQADTHEIDRLTHENELLRERIERLLEERKRMPTRQQCDYVKEYALRQQALYRASLARNVVLTRKLKERDG